MADYTSGGLGGLGGYSIGSSNAFPEPWTDAASLAMPESPVHIHRWCLPPGMLIELENLQFKPIESILPGDRVLTKNSGYQSVLGTSKRKTKEALVCIQTQSSSQDLGLHLTANHSLWRIPEGDYKALHANNLEKVQARDIREGDFLVTPLPVLHFSFTARRIRQLLARAIKLNGKAPKGHQSVVIKSCNEILARQLSRLANYIGLHPIVYLDKKSKTYQVQLSAADAIKLKDISSLIRKAKLRKPTKKPIGQLDFSRAKSRSFGGVAIHKSHDLLTRRDKIWAQKNPPVVITDDLVFQRVQYVTTSNYEGYVYNLEVASDHSYVANGITVANCEFIVSSQGHYRTALERVLSYFITDIDISEGDDDEKEKYAKFLEETLGIHDVLHKVGMDYLTYGNAFISVLMPFRRYLTCPKCFIEYPLHIVYNNESFKFQWTNYEFHATCQRCSYSGRWKHQDRRGGPDGIRIKRWNIHEIDLLWDTYTGDCDYIWKIPADYKKQLTEGKLYMLERANMEVIEAVKSDKYFRFAKDAVFHLKEEALAGVRSRGWGISRVLSNFRQSWYVQVLHRYNEAIALDYIIPFRVLTPAAGPGGGNPEAKDPVFNFGMGGFVGRVNAMLRRRRKDPAAWNVIPFPIDYKALGGDAKQLAPTELIQDAVQQLLNNAGIPQQLFAGDLTQQAAPAALRLFESHWTHLVRNLNRVLLHLSERLSELLSWHKVHLKLKRVTTADDLNRQMAILQLQSAHSISQTTGLASVGIDYREETKRLMEEQKFQAEETKKMQKELDLGGLGEQMSPSPQQQMSQQGQQSGGGQGQQGGGDPSQQPAPPSVSQQATAGMDPSSDVKISPTEMLARATQTAQQLLSLPESQRTSELIALKKANPTMHSIVTSCLNDMRQQARSAGGAMLLQQQQGGGGQQQQQ